MQDFLHARVTEIHYLPLHIFLVAQTIKNLPARRETRVQSLGREDPLEKKWHQYSCLENPMDRGAWWAAVHLVAKSSLGLGSCHSSAYMLIHSVHVLLFATPWTIVCQAPLSMGFFRQEYWSGLPWPPPRDPPNPGIEPGSPALAVWFFSTSTTSEPPSLL